MFSDHYTNIYELKHHIRTEVYWVNEKKQLVAYGFTYMQVSIPDITHPQLTQELNGTCQWHPKNDYYSLKEKQLLFSLNLSFSYRGGAQGPEI